MYGISALVPLTSQGNNVTGWRRKMLAVFTLANVFSFYFQSTNAAGYTAVYITVNVSYINRPFPSSKKSHLQSEAKCEAIDMKMIFNYDANKTHFHNKGFALSLVLKVRFFGTRKWPI